MGSIMPRWAKCKISTDRSMRPILWSSVGVLILATSIVGCSGGEPALTEERATPPAGSTSDAPDVQLDGCIPACSYNGGRLDPIPLPTGEYRTDGFFGGAMTVTFGSGWMSPEDTSGEFSARSLASPRSHPDLIVFWEDVYPVEHEERVEGVPLTAAGILNWMNSSPRLDVTARTTGAIGSLPAMVVDVSVAHGAGNEDPDCPPRYAPCILFLGFPQWFGPWGIAGEQVQRFYLSDVTYGGVDHLFVAVVYPDDPADLEAFVSKAAPILGSVHVPVAAA